MFGLSVDLFVQPIAEQLTMLKTKIYERLIKLEKYLGSLELYNI